MLSASSAQSRMSCPPSGARKASLRAEWWVGGAVGGNRAGAGAAGSPAVGDGWTGQEQGPQHGLQAALEAPGRGVEGLAHGGAVLLQEGAEPRAGGEQRPLRGGGGGGGEEPVSEAARRSPDGPTRPRPALTRGTRAQ